MTTPASSIPATMHRELTAIELDRAGLLYAERNVQISRFAIFVPADTLGAIRPITMRAGAVIGAFAIVHGGTTVGEQARVEEHAIVGKPELGYAIGRIYPGTGGVTVIGAGAVVRCGAIIYASVDLGVNTLVGHHTLLRTNVQVGAETQLGHHLTIERATRIGRDVRCSPGSHITGSTQIADQVFLGAGIRTINDKTLTWRDPNRTPDPGGPTVRDQREDWLRFHGAGRGDDRRARPHRRWLPGRPRHPGQGARLRSHPARVHGQAW